jgi:hypothetical protein
MKKPIVILIAIMVCSIQAFSQKGSTIWGDIFTGQVVTANEASRELTLQYAGKDKTETFVGALKEGYQIKMEDGSARELKVSELKPGTRIRVYYKKTSKEGSGQKRTTNVISRIEFLGVDEFARMRQLMKVAPSVPVILVESKTLPDADPLRLKIAGDDTVSSEKLMNWVGDWNKEQAKKYGAIRLVSDVEQADVTLVIHKGSESLAATVVPIISVFLVIEKPTGLEVVWKNPFFLWDSTLITPSVSYQGQRDGISRRSAEEIEKRLKFRHKGKQK